MLRVPMTLQNPVATIDQWGQRGEAWVNVAILYCHVEMAQTNEVMDDMGNAVRTDWRVLSSYHPSCSTRSRLLWNDNGTQRTFNVRACWDRDQRRRRLEIEATEVLP
jgi:head-tail adaptor